MTGKGSRRLIWVLVACLLLAVIATSALFVNASIKKEAQRPKTLTGVVHLLPGNYSTFGPPPRQCRGVGPHQSYEGLVEGAQVTISNERNEVLATSKMGPGRESDDGCRLQFVATVPPARIYQIKVPGVAIPLESTRKELEEDRWQFEIRLH